MCFFSILNGNGFAFENSLDSGYPFASVPARCTNRAVVWKKTSVLSIPGLAAGVPHLMPLSLHTCSFRIQPSIWRYIAFIPVPVRRYYSPGEDDRSSWCSDLKHSLMVRTREQHHSTGQVQSFFAETSGVCCACLGCMLPTWHHCHGIWSASSCRYQELFCMSAVVRRTTLMCWPPSAGQLWPGVAVAKNCLCCGTFCTAVVHPLCAAKFLRLCLLAALTLSAILWSLP